MKVLLVYPNLHGMNMIPSAIALFSSLLKAHGHEVRLFDSTNWLIPGEEEFDSDKVKEQYLNVRPFDDSILRSELKTTDVREDFEKEVLRFGPDLIAVSVTEDIFPVALMLLSRVRRYRIPTILGGVFPTFAPDLCLSYEEVDMVCVGEGERALEELCRRMERKLPISDIPNIWVKTRSGVRKNPLAPPVNLDENPPLDLSIFEKSRLYRPMQGRVWRMLPVETHRGCPYRCAYCNSPAQYDLYRKATGCNYLRKKSLEAIHRELRYFKDALKAEALYFWADQFIPYSDREVDAFVEMYQDIKLPFWCQAFPGNIKKHRIRKLMDVGLFRMASGIEHGNEQFRLRILRRRVSNETMIVNFAVLNELGLPFSVNNIIGFPTETRELAFDTIEVNRQINADSTNAYSFSPFHGTPLRTMAEELGYIDTTTIARSVTKPTLLRMAQFPPEAIEGLRRCFVLYVKMPKERWPEIAKAEQLTPEGHRIWQRLRDECAQRYMNLG